MGNRLRFLVGGNIVARNAEAIAFYVRQGFSLLGCVDLFQDLSPSPTVEWKHNIVLHGHELRY